MLSEDDFREAFIEEAGDIPSGVFDKLIPQLPSGEIEIDAVMIPTQMNPINIIKEVSNAK